MNFTTVALLVLAWQLLSNGKAKDGTEKKKNTFAPLTGLLNDDTKNLIDCVEKLSDKQLSQEDKTGALLQMVTNPAVVNIAGNFFGTGQSDEKQTAPDTSDSKTTSAQNDEGYTFKEKHSKESEEFFHPIDDVADEEIKHKLYWFYDNWYL